MFRLDGGTKKLTDACLSVSLSMVCGGFVKVMSSSRVSHLYKTNFKLLDLRRFDLDSRVTSHSDMPHGLKYIVLQILDVFIHLYLAISGYEMYTTMRADPCLCFVEQCGRPNEQDINAEQQAADPELGEGSVSNRSGLFLKSIVSKIDHRDPW